MPLSVCLVSNNSRGIRLSHRPMTVEEYEELSGESAFDVLEDDLDEDEWFAERAYQDQLRTLEDCQRVD